MKYKRTFIVIFLICIIGVLGFEGFLIRFHNMNMHQWLYPHMYQIDFIEKSFPCSKGKEQQYKTLVKEGYKKMAQETVVFCGLIRNGESSFPLMIERIEKTGKLFKDYKVVVFENDSIDGTRKLLKEWSKKNNNVHLIECDYSDCKIGHKPMYEYGTWSKDRMERMAYFRNFYLKEVKEKYNNFDYMMVVDLDIKGPWSNDGVAHVIAQKEWDAQFAYGLHSILTGGQLLLMYDALAYLGINDTRENLKSRFLLVWSYLKMNFYRFLGVKKGDPLIPVKSSFSGLGIYKIKSIMNAEYKKDLCEHIAFHEQMAQNGYGKLFINPSLLLLSGHQGPQHLEKLF
jgi:hypothetical protein